MESKNPILLEVRNLKKYFPIQQGFFRRVVGHVRAVDGVSFFIRQGETLGLVGESGCGKTTTGRCILRAYEPTAGEVLFRKDGEMVNVFQVPKEEMKALRREMQIIFQDPFSSLNPRMTVMDVISEPLSIHGIAKGDELKSLVRELLEAVGLRAQHMNRYPYAFSGGQRQRIHISDRVAVMYLGTVVELATAEELYANPTHPYTEALLSAVPRTDPDHVSQRIILPGDVPSPADPPPGCKFHPRCRYAQEVCKVEVPLWREMADDHWAACHRADELELGGI